MKLDEIKTGLNTSILGKEIIFYPETTSTNDVAIELAENGAVEGTLVIADSQSMGRGRRGRKWLAPPETCILASIILRPSLPLRQISIITPIAVTSVVKAIHNVTKLNASVKWPNDVIIMDRKVSGVLTEMRTERKISFIIVGIGVNVNVSRDSFPLEISDTATSLSIESGHDVSRIHLLQEILRHFENRYLRLNDNTFNEFLDEWKSLSVTIGKRIQIESVDDTRRGVALDIDEVGALIIQLDNGKIQKIANDDLVKVRAI